MKRRQPYTTPIRNTHRRKPTVSAAEADEISEVWDRVKDWSPPSRIALARRILESLETWTDNITDVESFQESPTRGVPVESVIGLLRTGQ